MAEDVNKEILVTGVRVNNSDVRIDYNWLEHKPQSDKTLKVDGGFADAKLVGEQLALKANSSDVAEQIKAIQEDTTNIDKAISTLEGSINQKLETKADITYVDSSTSVLNAEVDDEGKILRVVDGKASWQTASSALDATQEDEGNILTVVKDDESGSYVSKWVKPADVFTITSDGNAGDEGDGDSQDSAGKILTNVNGQTKWEDIFTALATTALDDDKNQFLSVNFTDEGKFAYWRSVINADEVKF